MEDVLDAYQEPYDPARPVACVDEGGEQLFGVVRERLPVRPGSPAERDSEYVRGGVANLFPAFEPLAGWRHVQATERKTGVDVARFLRVSSDGYYAAAERIVLVCDHRSTRTPAARYEAFGPAEARRRAGRFEWHDTPRHGRGLNVAELGLSVAARQCPDRRIPDPATLRREVTAWQNARNAAAVKVDWPFTTADARVKLKKLYPTLQLQ